ncbi:hypothetical protein ACIP88_13505 [Streptomyces uncialis]
MPARTRVSLVPMTRTAVPMRVLAVFLRHGSWNRLPYGRGGG